MKKTGLGWLALCGVLLAGALAGCGSPGQMSPEQRQAVELRRYCETHPEDIARCLGFLGDH